MASILQNKLCALSLCLLVLPVVECVFDIKSNSDLTCHNITALGLGQCCCSGCPSNTYGQPCHGDLSSSPCATNELIGPDGFGQSAPIDTGGICYAPGNCHFQNWQYKYQCCACPAKYIVYYGITGSQPGCDSSALCIGCTGANEVLAGSQSGGYSCTTTSTTTSSATATPSSCPGLTALSNSKLKGSQTVESPAFVNDINHLISCLPAGSNSALFVTSSSRCGPSPQGGITPLPPNQISMHQLGRAIDVNLYLPDGSLCNSACIARGYCAFHTTKASCQSAGLQSQPQNAQNIMINNFLTCAGNNGLEVGATYNNPDWVHFERQLPASQRQAAYEAYNPQLKNFCQGKCPNAPKTNPASSMCNCAGFQ